MKQGLCAMFILVVMAGCGDDSTGDDAPVLIQTPPTPATTPPVPDGTTPGTAGMVAPTPETPTTPPTPTTNQPMATFAPTFTAIFEEILTTGRVGNCMFGACHGGDPDPDLNGNLRIAVGEKEAAYQGLVNVVSTSTLCAGMPLVSPGDSAGSLLIQKFSDPPPCGVLMPIGTPLTEAHITQIATWIDNGAMND